MVNYSVGTIPAVTMGAHQIINDNYKDHVYYINTSSPATKGGTLTYAEFLLSYTYYKHYDSNGDFIEYGNIHQFKVFVWNYDTNGDIDIKQSSPYLSVPTFDNAENSLDTVDDQSGGYYRGKEVWDLTTVDNLNLSIETGDYIGLYVNFIEDAVSGFWFENVGGSSFVHYNYSGIICDSTDDTTVECEYVFNDGLYVTIPSSNLTDYYQSPSNNIASNNPWIYGEIEDISSGIGGEPKQSCHTNDNVYYEGDTIDDLWGNVYISQIWDTNDGKKCKCSVTFPWDESGDSTDDLSFYDGVKETFTNPDDSNEHCSYEFSIFISSSEAIFETTECWWKEPEGDVFVATYGRDGNYGTDWDDAFRTITHASDVVASGRYIYIDEGIYANESSAFPDGTPYNFRIKNDASYIVVSGDSLISGTVGEPFMKSSHTTDITRTVIDAAHPFANDGTVYRFNVNTQNFFSLTFRPVIVRPNVDTYELIYRHPTQISISPKPEMHSFNAAVDVKSGDLLGIVYYSNIWWDDDWSDEDLRYMLTDLTEDTLIADWSQLGGKYISLSASYVY